MYEKNNCLAFGWTCNIHCRNILKVIAICSSPQSKSNREVFFPRKLNVEDYTQSLPVLRNMGVRDYYRRSTEETNMSSRNVSLLSQRFFSRGEHRIIWRALQGRYALPMIWSDKPVIDVALPCRAYVPRIRKCRCTRTWSILEIPGKIALRLSISRTLYYESLATPATSIILLFRNA